MERFVFSPACSQVRMYICLMFFLLLLIICISNIQIYAICYVKDFDIRHYIQAFEPNSCIPGVLIGIIVEYFCLFVSVLKLTFILCCMYYKGIIWVSRSL